MLLVELKLQCEVAWTAPHQSSNQVLFVEVSWVIGIPLGIIRYHPFLDGIFHDFPVHKNPPAIGVAPWLWKAPHEIGKTRACVARASCLRPHHNAAMEKSIATGQWWKICGWRKLCRSRLTQQRIIDIHRVVLQVFPWLFPRLRSNSCCPPAPYGSEPPRLSLLRIRWGARQFWVSL